MLLVGEGACPVDAADGKRNSSETGRERTGDETGCRGEGPTENGYPVTTGLSKGPSPKSSGDSPDCKRIFMGYRQNHQVWNCQEIYLKWQFLCK